MEQQCITSYILSWDGGTYTSFETSVSFENLASSGFPYCHPLLLTVTPVTHVALVTETSQAKMITLQLPGKQL